MMPAFSPALDSALPASPSSALAAAGEGSDRSPFAAVIQGLSPDAAPAAAPAAATALTPPTAGSASTMPAPATSPANALESVLQALGLGTALMLPDDVAGTASEASGSDAEAGLVASPADGLTGTATGSPVTPLPLLSPPLPVVAQAPALQAPALQAAASSGASTLDDPALGSASGSPLQQQARQWLAALAPSPADSDTAGPGDASLSTPLQPTAPASVAAVTSPSPSPLMAASQGGQQSLAAFFNMTPVITPGPERGSALSDLGAITSDSLSLLNDAPKGLVTGTPGGLPAAQSFAQTLSSASPAAPVVATVLPNALNDTTWSDAFGQRVAVLAQQGTQTATLQLNPPELGPIQVSIALGEKGARVEFNTARQTTSDLIETAMPRLAAAFEHQGLRLDDTRVNLISNRHDVFSAPSAFSASRQDTPQGDRGQPMPQQPSRASSGSADRHADAMPGSESASKPLKLHNTAIDYYA